jgi:hypothetical protein
MNFQVGDKVRAFGCEGRVIMDYMPAPFPLLVTLGSRSVDDIECRFMADGRSEEWHKEPSLVLVERPKKTVKKKMYRAVFWNPGSDCFCMADPLYVTREEAFVCSDIAGTVEVEVEMLEEEEEK